MASEPITTGESKMPKQAGWWWNMSSNLAAMIAFSGLVTLITLIPKSTGVWEAILVGLILLAAILTIIHRFVVTKESETNITQGVSLSMREEQAAKAEKQIQTERDALQKSVKDNRDRGDAVADKGKILSDKESSLSTLEKAVKERESKVLEREAYLDKRQLENTKAYKALFSDLSIAIFKHEDKEYYLAATLSSFERDRQYAYIDVQDGKISNSATVDQAFLRAVEDAKHI